MVDRIVSWFLFTFVSITRLHSHLTTLRKLLWPHFPRFNQHESFKVWKTGLNGWTGWLSGSYPRQNGGWLTAKKISAKFLSDQNTTSQSSLGKKRKEKRNELIDFDRQADSIHRLFCMLLIYDKQDKVFFYNISFYCTVVHCTVVQYMPKAFPALFWIRLWTSISSGKSRLITLPTYVNSFTIGIDGYVWKVGFIKGIWIVIHWWWFRAE